MRGEKRRCGDLPSDWTSATTPASSNACTPGTSRYLSTSFTHADPINSKLIGLCRACVVKSRNRFARKKTRNHADFSYLPVSGEVGADAGEQVNGDHLS
jgi:hypothetical protein